MANSKSSKKRVKINERHRIENRNYKGAIKRSIKTYLDLLNKFYLRCTPELLIETKDSLKIAISSLDKAVKKGVIHKNKSIRKKIQLYFSFKNNIKDNING